MNEIDYIIWICLVYYLIGAFVALSFEGLQKLFKEKE